MLDSLGRPLRDLRISVTDRCNLRCGYCMPREVYGSGFRFLPREELLSFEEIARVTRSLAGVGVRKVRITGGEPLLRRDLPALVEMLAQVDQIDDLAMTTNGVLLAAKAIELAEAGLDRVTVSLDALDPATLRRMSDSPLSPERVLAGIDAAYAAGLGQIKVNMVVRRGFNDHCILEMAEHFRHTPHVLRFIEFMDVGATNGWRAAEVVTGMEILTALARRWPLEPMPAEIPGEVASRYRYRDGAGEIGVIHSVTEPFCGGCTRARLSADGKLYTCLFAGAGHDLRSLLRSGREEDLDRRLSEIWSARSDRYSAERERLSEAGGHAAKVEMSYIGG
ncbi:MAG TPA: GTP 3',8-cyclase MoaA [Solirubrobacteraceae bacterium]|nr:GTP 3',8-cyclase MoaA [Solirubrobacteraceae bacterium]